MSIRFIDRIDAGHGYDAYVFRFSGIGGRTVRIYRAGTDVLVREFKSTGSRDIGIENARECARVLAEESA